MIVGANKKVCPFQTCGIVRWLRTGFESSYKRDLPFDRTAVCDHKDVSNLGATIKTWLRAEFGSIWQRKQHFSAWWWCFFFPRVRGFWENVWLFIPRLRLKKKKKKKEEEKRINNSCASCILLNLWVPWYASFITGRSGSGRHSRLPIGKIRANCHNPVSSPHGFPRSACCSIYSALSFQWNFVLPLSVTLPLLLSHSGNKQLKLIWKKLLYLKSVCIPCILPSQTFFFDCI